ncbi:NAD(P)H-dependent oxidoreductase [Halomonas piscis]|uniref:NAD(P)H-dependent oxidoreductase n=1 Tax=Halomonas piscis TaxID=3031727 RepID=A0ABY9YZA9_9GAMM|nr:NAD(P)H-dependent oxidoreductase [Halomonas piscis]WNK20205.1 NAD(P)H-dependent oxidoreductase [Halomonas piscis]
MNLLIFLGSARQSTPPRPAQLGERVALACQAHLQSRLDGASVTLIDPLDFDTGPVFKPHFAYSERRVPEPLEKLAQAIDAADAYVMVSPEYNHSMSPALADLLNHFGASRFAYKPSAIVTYSAGQWGGVRAAVGMRSFLSELGCLPVSAMVHVHQAQNVFSEDGGYQADVDKIRWESYLNRTFTQLWWWADAAQRQRQQNDPHRLVGHFTHAPSQRNAP